MKKCNKINCEKEHEEARIALVKIIELIGLAKRRISICMYQFTLAEIVQAINKQIMMQPHLEIRILVHQLTRKNSSGELSKKFRKEMQILEKHTSRAEIRKMPKRKGSIRSLMHEKFVIFDELALIHGSMNFTFSGMYVNNDHITYDESVKLVASFSEHFNKLWIKASVYHQDE